MFLYSSIELNLSFMNQVYKRAFATSLLSTLFLLLFTSVTYAQSGKISGFISDSNGEALPGVNVVIVGSSQGAASSLDGYYQILNVKPGVYSLRATFIGFSTIIIENVNVAIDLTTEVNIVMQEEVIEGQEIVITAEKPVVQRDVSASVTSIQADEIATLPVTDVLATPASSALAAIINLFRKSGVPLVPSHNNQPLGIVAIVPDHIIIPPLGNPLPHVGVFPEPCDTIT